MWRRRNAIDAVPMAEPAQDDDDRVVVLRAIVDRHAFAPLYEKYLTPVYRRCHGHLGNVDDAWDATAITFQKALAGLDSFRGNSFAAWLMRIADHACTDVHRTRKRRPQSSLNDEFELPSPDPDPESQAVATMDRERLEHALTRLPDRRARIVRLHLIGLTGKEIAAQLGVSHDVVRQQQRLAFLQLADLLDVDRELEAGDG